MKTPPCSPKPLEKAFAIAFSEVPPPVRGGEPIRVGPASELAPGQSRIIRHGDLSIGLFHLEGRFYALRNHCPHQGAPLCRGSLHGTYAPAAAYQYDPALEGMVLRCPWHGWEFDLKTGKGLYDAATRVRTYATRVDEEGILWIDP